MEVVHHQKCCKVSPQEGEDVISSMPENVVTNIMDRLPLRDVVRTSILSRCWRFKWTLLTQLILDMNFFRYLLRRKVHFDKTNISRLLFHLRGAVTNFWLFIKDEINLDDEDIHHWVMLLSRKGGLKELTLINWRKTPVKLPTHLFSCLDLKHLHLDSCVLSPLPYFRGFPKLLSLNLCDVTFHDHRCGELIALCPLLETLELSNYKLREEVKLVEITKLENVKMLTLSLCSLDNMSMVRLSTVFQHLSLLPKLQELELGFGNCEFLPEDETQNLVSITFPFLKTLTLRQLDFSSNSMSSSAFGMLFGCTKLETLCITAIHHEAGREPDIEVDCNMIGHLELRSVSLTNIKGNENEVCLIKSILAHSPSLNEITIYPSSSLISDSGDVKLWFVKKLLGFPRVSSTAVIDIGEQVKVSQSYIRDLEQQVLRVETALQRKKHENYILDLQIQQIDKKWEKHKAKMDIKEKSWQDEFTSIQMSIASTEEETTNEITCVPQKPTRQENVNKNITIRQILERQESGFGFQMDNKLNSRKGQEQELRKLKGRFKAWKKEFKTRLHDVKRTLDRFDHCRTQRVHKSCFVS